MKQGCLRSIIQKAGLILFALLQNVVSLSQITADPDLIGCGVEFLPAIKVKAGDLVPIGIAAIGGFIESRNEPRFNQGLLPNHNWRGFISGAGFYPLFGKVHAKLSLTAGIEHESSHATMGIAEATKQPFELIYDNTYRKSALNSLQSGARFETFDANDYLLCKGTMAFYLLSKNTPELSGLKTGSAIGFSFGSVYRHLFGKKSGFFLSVHERHIFKGQVTSHGNVYYLDNGSLIEKQVDYSVMNKIGTLSFCTGFSFPFFQARHLCEIYLRFLYGHNYGFVDSRETRSLLSVGMALTGF
jgi:hypothetical protein